MTNIGVAAHIHAAAPTGARYLPEMTTEQRRDIRNAIWLCNSCGTMIDRDPERFPEDVLRQWRSGAEQHAIDELGRPLPSQEDAVNQLVTALSGRVDQFMASAISNVHRATETALEALDTRVRVETSFGDGTSRIRLHARGENVELQFRTVLSDQEAQAVAAGFAKLIDKGHPLHIPMRSASIVGSPLLDKLLENYKSDPTATLSIVPNRVAAKTSISAYDPVSKRIILLEDFVGHLFGNSDSLQFAGTACAAAITMRIRSESDTMSVSITFDLTRWHGIDILRLPYFDRIEALNSALHKRAELVLTIEANGERVEHRAAMPPTDGKNYYDALHAYLGYIKLAQSLSSYTNTSIPLDKEFLPSKEQAVGAYIAVSAFDNRFDMQSGIAVEILTSAKYARSMVAGGLVQEFVLEQDATSIKVFGADVSLPPIAIKLENVVPTADVDLDAMSDSESIVVALRPGPDFRIVCRLATSAPTEAHCRN